jgi:hypothetical protein
MSLVGARDKLGGLMMVIELRADSARPMKRARMRLKSVNTRRETTMARVALGADTDTVTVLPELEVLIQSITSDGEVLPWP